MKRTTTVTKSSSRLWRAASFTLVAAVASAVLSGEPAEASQGRHAVWVWPKTETHPDNFDWQDPAKRAALVEDARDSGVDTIYLSTFLGDPVDPDNNPAPNPGQGLMLHWGALHDIITKAHAEGIEVFATGGDPGWPDLWVSGHTWPHDRIWDVINYNCYYDENPDAQFDGYNLDQGHSWESQNLLTYLKDATEQLLTPNELKAAASMKHWWNAPIEYPVGSGDVRPCYEHVIDLDLDHLFVASYWENHWGMIDQLNAEIAYADAQGKAGMIVAGVETLPEALAPGIISYYQEGQDAMNAATALVAQHFANSASFGGFGVHAYGMAYLGGTDPGWPTINPGLGVTFSDADGDRIDDAVDLDPANPSTTFSDGTTTGVVTDPGDGTFYISDAPNQNDGVVVRAGSSAMTVDGSEEVTLAANEIVVVTF